MDRMLKATQSASPFGFLKLGSMYGMLAVFFGAFGAHALKLRLDERALAVFKTGVEYQMWHALALVLVGCLQLHYRKNDWLRRAGSCFTFGVGVFCGSLYLLALTGQRWWGAITPIGGVAFLAGWACLFVAITLASRSASPD